MQKPNINYGRGASPLVIMALIILVLVIIGGGIYLLS